MKMDVEVVLATSGTTTVALVNYPNSELDNAVGIARLHPTDTFEPGIGERIALGRALIALGEAQLHQVGELAPSELKITRLRERFTARLKKARGEVRRAEAVALAVSRRNVRPGSEWTTTLTTFDSLRFARGGVNEFGAEAANVTDTADVSECSCC